MGKLKGTSVDRIEPCLLRGIWLPVRTHSLYMRTKFRIFILLLSAKRNISWPSPEVVAVQLVGTSLPVPGKCDKNKLSKTHLNFMQMSLVKSMCMLVMCQHNVGHQKFEITEHPT
jgi:hypothetical protein